MTSTRLKNKADLIFSFSSCPNKCHASSTLCDRRKYVYINSRNGQTTFSGNHSRLRTELVLQKFGISLNDRSIFNVWLRFSILRSIRFVISKCQFCFSRVDKMNLFLHKWWKDCTKFVQWILTLILLFYLQSILFFKGMSKCKKAFGNFSRWSTQHNVARARLYQPNSKISTRSQRWFEWKPNDRCQSMRLNDMLFDVQFPTVQS